MVAFLIGLNRLVEKEDVLVEKNNNDPVED
jgi:hypothetical protein